MARCRWQKRCRRRRSWRAGFWKVRLADVSTLIHGSTVVVNAIIERNGAKTALVTTKGFRDVYEIGRINRPESFNPRFRKHRPLVPREDIFEVTERRLADGSVRTPFDEPEPTRGTGPSVPTAGRPRGGIIAPEPQPR